VANGQYIRRAGCGWVLCGTLSDALLEVDEQRKCRAYEPTLCDIHGCLSIIQPSIISPRGLISSKLVSLLLVDDVCADECMVEEFLPDKVNATLLVYVWILPPCHLVPPVEIGPSRRRRAPLLHKEGK
jgi:hypothetical protein